MSVDVAGPQEGMADPRIHYGKQEDARIAYTAPGTSRRFATRHQNGHIVVRDLVSGSEGIGETYLEALRAVEH